MSLWWLAALAVGALTAAVLGWAALVAHRERMVTDQLGDELRALRRIVADVASRVPRPPRAEETTGA